MIPAWPCCFCQSFKESGAGRRPAAEAPEITEPDWTEKEKQPGQETKQRTVKAVGTPRWDLSCSSLKYEWQAPPPHPATLHCPLGPLGLPQWGWPFTESCAGKGPVCRKQKYHPFLPYSLVVPGNFRGEMPQKHYLQKISRDPVNLKGSGPLGPAWPSPAGSAIHPPSLLASLLANICCAVVHKPGLTVRVERGTHTAPDKLATSSCMPSRRCVCFLWLP